MRATAFALVILGFVSLDRAGHTFISIAPLPGASLETVDVPCTGTPVQRGTALRSAVESTGTGTVQLGACLYEVGALSRDGYNTGILIRDKDGLRIQGAGAESTIVRFQRPVYIGFEIQSNTRNLTMTGMTIAGSITQSLCTENPDLNSPTRLCYGSRLSSHPNTTGIGTREHEGQVGIDGITLTNLEVRDLANGIWIGSGGDCDRKYINATVSDNYIHDIHGTYSWSGYGISTGCAQNVAVRNNTIARVGRHSIYQPGTALSNPYPIVIIGNTIVDHGHGEIMTPDQGAIAIARSDNVTVIDNKVVGGHGHAVTVEYADGRDCTRCLLIGNKFINASPPNRPPFDILVTAHSPVGAWFNTRNHSSRPKVADPGRRLEDVAGPGDFWSGTQAIAAMHDDRSGNDYVYVMQKSVLHRVKPDYGVRPDSAGQWHDYAYSTINWSGFFGMSADDGRVYVWQADRLAAVTPDSLTGAWRYTSSSGWSNPGGMASSGDGYLYVIQNAILHRLRPADWSSVQSSTDWGRTPYGMAAGRHGVVYLHSDARSPGVFTVTVGNDRTAWPQAVHDR